MQVGRGRHEENVLMRPLVLKEGQPDSQRSGMEVLGHGLRVGVDGKTLEQGSRCAGLG